jgi:hypothetical protein
MDASKSLGEDLSSTFIIDVSEKLASSAPTPPELNDPLLDTLQLHGGRTSISFVCFSLVDSPSIQYSFII